MSLGAMNAGIDVQLAIERDPHAARTYRCNQTRPRMFNSDIRVINPDHLVPWRDLSRDLIVFAGPPCQGFSWSNSRTRSPENSENWLFREALRVIRILNPVWIVIENVRGVVDTAHGMFLDQLKRSLAGDYLLAEKILNAKYFGVPQNRSRYFLVGNRCGAKYDFPNPTANTSPTVYDAIQDLPSLKNGAAISWKTYARTPPSQYACHLRSKLSGCNNNIVTKNAPYILKRYSYIPQGGNWQNIPPGLMTNYKNRSRCHTGVYHRLRLNQPSIVIGNFRKNMLIHPTEDRGLSVREAARIQSFPDQYEFTGSIGFQQQQVGNAVPPLLAEAVFSSILKVRP